VGSKFVPDASNLEQGGCPWPRDLMAMVTPGSLPFRPDFIASLVMVQWGDTH
jgi:hypothetical protein